MAVPANPLTESPYVAGNITITAGTTINVWSAVKAQLDPNCGGSPVQLIFVADATNAADINVGDEKTNATVFGYNLSAGFSRLYAAGTRFGIIPFSRIYAYSASTAILHVEMYI